MSKAATPAGLTAIPDLPTGPDLAPIQSLAPLREKVLVRPIIDELVTKPIEEGGIYLPEMSRSDFGIVGGGSFASGRRCSRGVVVAVGDGRVLTGEKTGTNCITIAPLQVSPGDIVLVGSYAGTEVDVGGEPHFLMGEDEIMAVIGREATC